MTTQLEGKLNMQTKLTEFTTNLDSKAVEIVEKLAGVIASVDSQLTSDIKWRQLTFALEGDYHHWICAIAVTKKSVNLVFHFGGLLDDPDKVLIAGTSKFPEALVPINKRPRIPEFTYWD
ncbi:MAG TPA: DUF1801 domain-containing protein [bacterium]|nr:DUF1801 domain-containing protein [bacterium]